MHIACLQLTHFQSSIDRDYPFPPTSLLALYWPWCTTNERISEPNELTLTYIHMHNTHVQGLAT